MAYQILSEHLTPIENKIITETPKDDKDMYLSGIFMQSGVKNRNNRVYPHKLMVETINSAKSMINDNNGIFGELDHPDTLLINLDRVSHVIQEMTFQDGNVFGKAKVLSTPCGLILQELMKSKCGVGVSSRGGGEVSTTGDVVEYAFKTVDVVAQPSAPGAKPIAIYESLLANSHGKEVISLSRQLHDDNKAQKYFKREVLKFISSMNFSKIK